MARFRWTLDECQTKTDYEMLLGIVNERLSDLNPYSPLAKRLKLLAKKLEKGEDLLKAEYLWIRLGDSGDYQRLDSVYEAAQEFAEHRIFGPLHRSQYSIEVSGMEGDNRISCFWGDAEAQPTRDLSSEEFKELKRSLAARKKEMGEAALAP